MILRVGIPEVNGSLVRAASDAGYPIMVSASRMWRKAAGKFSSPGKALDGMDVFLDSAGFTAMRQWGGFPWTPEQYLGLAAAKPRTHWSQMDLCCEPEVASDRKEVYRRVTETGIYLGRLTRMADDAGIRRPLPVLQGWVPDDYQRSAEMADLMLGGRWPKLVGIGSVCRRNLHGADGVSAILGALDRVLPPGVKVHLFGVKSAALAAIAQNHRVHSSDSMAWDFAARMDCRKAGVPFSIPVRVESMHRWMQAQRAVTGCA
jgi:hypothetical protein